MLGGCLSLIYFLNPEFYVLTISNKIGTSVDIS